MQPVTSSEGTIDYPEGTEHEASFNGLPDDHTTEPEMTLEQMQRLIGKLNGIANKMRAKEKSQAQARNRSKLAKQSRKQNRQKRKKR